MDRMEHGVEPERGIGAEAGGEALGSLLRGEVIAPSDPDYDWARALYNGMIDKRPGLIAHCADVADVMEAVRYGRQRGLLTAVRGGGHSGPGLGSCDGGLVIDLVRMRGVWVDAKRRVARVGGGCTWGDVDHATHAFGLATPGGVLSTTGVGGLTLGGGHGYLSRRYGLTIDNLLSADVVLANGQLVRASADEHPDLFWALRGGGGNFGVVTSFELQLHPVSTVHAGPMLWSLDNGAEVLRWFRDFMPAAAEDIYGFFLVMRVPPASPFPEHLHGQAVVAIVWCSTASEEAALAAEAAVRAVAPPVFEHVGPMPYPAMQSAFDALYPPGLRWYWRGDFFREISDEAVERHLEFAARTPTLHSSMHLYPIDGAPQRVAEDATAFAHRDAGWSQVIVGVDPDPENDEAIIQWTRDYWDALHPLSAGAAYINFMMDEGNDRVRATYGGNYDRLVEVKRTYDPTNFFRVNQNIRPD